ncbi:partner of Y14 and mago [Venturia canescens]|uniref:partner of Y14 and mago n=1 Tax=Venturia canescens TaxID=32260 RepID=UPI001C9BCE8E|nr:partner of Y14 and mago [Venturia canescens]
MATAYVKDDQGGTFIAASQRPDGTWRKPRRVKDGYVPQEEVPLYESLGKQFLKNKPTHPPGVSAEYIAAQKAKKEGQSTKTTIPGMPAQVDSKKKKKKSKSKGNNTITEDLAKTTISESEATIRTKNSVNSTPKPQSVVSCRQDAMGASHLSESMKRLKNLRKKIREIETLEQKIRDGVIKNPEKEMLEKVSRKSEIQEEIKLLESNQ